VINSLIVLFLCNPGILFVLFANEYFYSLLRNSGSDINYLTFPMGIILSVSIGICSGIELPVFSKLFEVAKRDKEDKGIVTILTSDYLGAFLGSLFFAFFLFPFYGLVGSIVIIQFLTLINVNFYSYKFKLFENKKFFGVVTAFNIYILMSLIFRRNIVEYLDSLSI
jgi:predicted membrane-bound spermidine synthase